MKYADYLDNRKKDLTGNTAKVGELVEVEAARLLYNDLRQASHLARAVALGAKGDPAVSVEEVISIHALINAYYRNGYNSLVASGHIIELPVTEPDPNPTQPPPIPGAN